MNKYQEALEYITPRLKDYRTVKEDKFELQYNNKVSNDYNAIQAIKELVRKETPVKPVYRIPDISWNKNEKLPHCPTCDWLLGWERGCHNNKCRQKIDWSEE